MTIKLIVGLANAGVEYIKTRHNAGAWYIDLLAKLWSTRMYEEPKFFGHISHINLTNSDVFLLIPNTSINFSGNSVSALAKFYHINPNEILIAHDELDLPPGVAKFKLGGNCSHNGIKDIRNNLGNSFNFYRLRIGIGHPGNKNEVKNFVLNEPSIYEKKLINRAITEAVHCTEIWFSKGLIKAVNYLHSFKAQ